NKNRNHIDSWKILIVDATQQMHDQTKNTLKDVMFEQKPVTFLHVYSAKEAEQLLSKYDDIAIIILSAELETKDGSVHLVDYLRKDLQNNRTRIFLLIDQPDQLPINEVIISQDINECI